MPTISRRNLVKGTALAGATMAAVGLAGCSNDADEDAGQQFSGEPQVVDDSKTIDVTEDYESVEDVMEPQFSWDLPVGTIPFHCGGAWAALFMAPESAHSVNTLGVISLASGNWNTLIAEPTQGKSYGFHDVRCSDGVFAWVEMDYASGAWVLIAQEMSNGELQGDAVQLDKGNIDWEPARFTATNNSVIWQKMPTASGSKRAEHSHCLMWSVGDSESTDLFESPGRFATTPRTCEGILTIVPRVKADEGTFYGITALDLENKNKVLDQMVMPENVRPFEAVYMGSSFAFSVEANYGYGGSLGSMGSFIGREDGPFVTVPREPLACIAGKGSRYFVKVRSSYFVLDTDKETLGYLSAPDKTLEYGDYPASEGTTDRFVTYATVRGDDGLAAAVRLRVFAL